jgi:peptidoglycan/LPS O-acetylase OafA/YrhL
MQFVSTPTTINLVNFFALMPIVLELSALSYYCIERPFLGLRGRYIEISDGGAP